MYSGVPMRMVSMLELLAFQCFAKPVHVGERVWAGELHQHGGACRG